MSPCNGGRTSLGGRFYLLAALAILTSPWPAHGNCLPVSSDPSLRISPENKTALNDMGFQTADVFNLLHTLAVPETHGCWSAVAGNRDEQILSAGVLQFALNKDRLQPVLKRFQAELPPTEFAAFLKEKMPRYGSLLFSPGCLRTRINKYPRAALGVTEECKQKLLSLQVNNQYPVEFIVEVNTLFSSQTMRQIQLDEFLALLTSSKKLLSRLFPGKPTPIQVKWALDLNNQSGSYFTQGTLRQQDVDEVRKKLASSTPSERMRSVLGILKWYNGLCVAFTQEGVWRDCDYNLRLWCQESLSGHLSAEEIDLLHLTFLRSRITAEKGGLYEALAFQRRATIALGSGSLAGSRFGPLTQAPPASASCL